MSSIRVNFSTVWGAQYSIVVQQEESYPQDFELLVYGPPDESTTVLRIEDLTARDVELIALGMLAAVRKHPVL